MSRGTPPHRSGSPAYRPNSPPATPCPGPSLSLLPHSLEVRLDHHGDEPVKRGARFPPELRLYPLGIPTERRHVRRPSKPWIDRDAILPIEPDAIEGNAAEFLNGRGVPGGDHVLAALLGSHHQPHGPDLVTGEAPIALGVAIPQPELSRPLMLDPAATIRDLLSHKFKP